MNSESPFGMPTPDHLENIYNIPTPEMMYLSAAPNQVTPSDQALLEHLPTPSLSLSCLTSGPMKKSHARKQPAGHIPRPRNAFILFRCDLVRQKRIPGAIEHDHRNISRVAGKLWQKMSAEARQPWLRLAEKEKERHAILHPGYRYSPVPCVEGVPMEKGRKRKAKNDRDHMVDARAEEVAHLLAQGVENSELVNATSLFSFTPPTDQPSLQLPYRRSSSCPPPGAIPVSPTISHEFAGSSMYPLTTRDDLAGRRPSRITMYHSQFSGPTNMQDVALPVYYAADPWCESQNTSRWFPTDLQSFSTTSHASYGFMDTNLNNDLTSRQFSQLYSDTTFHDPFSSPGPSSLLTTFAPEPVDPHSLPSRYVSPGDMHAQINDGGDLIYLLRNSSLTGATTSNVNPIDPWWCVDENPLNLETPELLLPSNT